ncbi:hypothetical protein HPB50_019854 [Hyalomma asiaticum]|uniref:Uncharacterized protein n=1 Tax=Hyalomma asiaticum TaxID=266040 RepID=A0ACB7RPM1_HYAAI|nr:hypothetical protein HPB50_019854 [Hyalomma asiaticum]
MHDSERNLTEKSLDGSVGGPPPKPMFWVFITAVLLLVGIIAVSLINSEGGYGHESELTALPRQADLLQLDNTAVSVESTATSPRLQYADEDTNNASWLLTRSVNPAVNACLDLHAYVCGGYAGAVGRSLEEYVAANTVTAIKIHFLAVAGHSSRRAKASHDSETKAVAFYNGCMKVSRNRQEGPAVPANARALASFLERNNLRFRHADGIDLVDKALELLTRYDLQVFFALQVQFFPRTSWKKSFVRVVDSPVFEQWKARKVDLHRADIAKFIENVLSLSGVNERRITDLTDSVRSIEDRVQEARIADEKPDEPTVAAWRRYLYVHTRRAYAGAYDLDVEKSSGARSFRAAARVLDGGQRSVYLSWHVARHVAEVARLVGLHSGDVEDDAKTYCYDQVYGEYKHAVMAAYLFKFVNESRIQEVRKMVRSITTEVRKSIRRSSWLPAETRVKLEKKVRRMKWRIGYPTGLGKWKGVDEFYGRHPHPTGVFVTDYLGAREARMRAFFAALRGGNVTKHEVFDFANDAPGIVYGTPNKVSVPAVALVRPLFNYRGAPELNYGLLGSLVVEAIMRAFGGADIMDDGHGQRIPWSTNHQRLFREKYRCDDLRGGPRVMSQASQSNVHAKTTPSSKPQAKTSRPGVSVGAHALFRAYKKAAATNSGGGRSLRGFEALSGDQLFHVGRCFVACGDAHDGSVDPLFTRHRCNRMARQSSEFASAFRCNGASWTSASSRCDFW